MNTIYILKLEEGKYYVGRTKDLNKRTIEHFKLNGSEWTKKYKPVEILSTHVGDNFEEEKLTLTIMDKYGIDNVRGGSYCKISLSDSEKEKIQQIIYSLTDKCYECGNIGHYSKNCQKKQKANEITETKNIEQKVNISSILAKNESNQKSIKINISVDLDDAYKCNICNNSYKSKNSLQKHIRQNHQNNNIIKEKKHACKFCFEKFRTRQTKWSHEQKCKITNETPLVEQVKKLTEEIKEIKNTNIFQTKQIKEYIIKNISTENIMKLPPEIFNFIREERLINFIDFISLIHFNKAIPEYHIFCVTALNDKYASVIDTKTNKKTKIEKSILFSNIINVHFDTLKMISTCLFVNKSYKIAFNENITKINKLLLSLDGITKIHKELNLLAYNNKEIVLETWNYLKNIDVLIKVNSDTDSDTESVEDAEIKIKNTTYIIEGNKLYLKLESGKGAFYGTYSNGKVKKANKNIEL